MNIFLTSMWSSRFSGPRAFRSTRRTATVTMSAPEASCASRMTCRLGYLPVPTIRRDLNSRPARISPSPMVPIVALAPADEGDDLHRVTVAEARRGVLGARDHAPVVLDGDARAVQREDAQQVGDGR